jgi:hypothetical protein
VIDYKWCKPCQINNLVQNFANCTNGNEKINGLIQEMRLKINTWDDVVFEWIPYNQFIDIKEIGKNNSATVYLATWKDGSFEYNNFGRSEWKRMPNKKVVLKCLYNSQNFTDEFLNEVYNF